MAGLAGAGTGSAMPGHPIAVSGRVAPALACSTSWPDDGDVDRGVCPGVLNVTGVNAAIMTWPMRVCALGWLMAGMGGMAAVQCMMAAWVCGLACGLITNARGPPPVAEMTGVSAAGCAPSGELTTMLAGAWGTMKK